MKQTLTHLCKRVILGMAVSSAALFYIPVATAENAGGQHAFQLDVHKSPSCGCCGAWVDHMKDAGFITEVNETHDMHRIKQDLGIDSAHQSCHTAVSADGDYFFEGHVPAPIVAQFLKEKPANAAGLAVAGMPIGSPGMERGNRFDAYKVLQINKDGSVEVYASVDTAAQQYSEVP